MNALSSPTADSLTVALCAGQSALAVPPFVTFADLPSFQAALGGAPTSTQGFEGLAAGTDLLGVAILPGVTGATTGTTLQAFNSGGIGHIMFGSPRTGDESHYDLILSSPYNAIAFDIQAFDPNAEAGTLEVFFTDATSALLNIGPGVTEWTPVFFGIVVGGNIASVRWSEPLEPRRRQRLLRGNRPGQHRGRAGDSGALADRAAERGPGRAAERRVAAQAEVLSRCDAPSRAGAEMQSASGDAAGPFV
jgi:hypothetical protein